MKRKASYCDSCHTSRSEHVYQWVNALIESIIPSHTFSLKHRGFNVWLDGLIERFFLAARLTHMSQKIDHPTITLRTRCLLAEARNQGLESHIIKSRFAYTDHGIIRNNRGEIMRFDGLPIMRYGSDLAIAEDKIATKLKLAHHDIPVAPGKAFWFWHKTKAIDYGISELGFPLVVKPSNGSVSRHVTTDIRSEQALRIAIDYALEYGPQYIIERYIDNAHVYRATVIDHDFVACLQQAPAHVIGDGIHSINQLVTTKNGARKMSELLQPIMIDDTTDMLLQERNYTLASIPTMGERVLLQRDPFLKLGGDSIEVTSMIHPDNRKLAQTISRIFHLPIVGIDVMLEDVRRPWHQQTCAVLEVNTLPSIELHHFPSEGQPQNVAAAILKMILKV